MPPVEGGRHREDLPSEWYQVSKAPLALTESPLLILIALFVLLYVGDILHFHLSCSYGDVRINNLCRFVLFFAVFTTYTTHLLLVVRMDMWISGTGSTKSVCANSIDIPHPSLHSRSPMMVRIYLRCSRRSLSLSHFIFAVPMSKSLG